MATLTFPLNDGTSIPALAFGTGTALYNKDARDAVTTAITSGFVHLDGAQMYGNEDSLGDAIVASGKPRESLYITTKLTELKNGATVKSALQESLRKLKVDYVNLFLIHMPTHHEGRLKEVWKQMEEVKKEGLAKSIGVSNFRIKDFEEFLPEATIKPAVNQIEFHPYLLKASEQLLEYTTKLGIRTESYGGLTPIVRARGGPLDPVLAKIRERLEKTAGKPVSEGQVLSKWLLQKEIVVVTTSSKPERVKEYLDVPNLPDLSPEEVAEIESTGKKQHTRAFCQFLDK
ncbi:Aldo/keto reductase [Gloeophyllum trabeum ATCC 11539]|uniref:Aldo/keto reductase n=1 Tax=Gloeophyllum trabeum (strain ATCC 11539 / FP-39264 / Madison 617) TaxID=670483 RepID=S7QFW5_GLOTA|nr:Aldo/keto reductase [Gloeophyllum trabeum ATCC 11539]EPQ58043.1 Aldo/keto reductase [Gloeophyllum trabeum ATCC 11539]